MHATTELMVRHISNVSSIDKASISSQFTGNILVGCFENVSTFRSATAQSLAPQGPFIGVVCCFGPDSSCAGCDYGLLEGRADKISFETVVTPPTNVYCANNHSKLPLGKVWRRMHIYTRDKELHSDESGPHVVGVTAYMFQQALFAHSITNLQLCCLFVDFHQGKGTARTY